jgi:hypothetical protein
MSINKDIDLEDIEKIKEEFNKQLKILEVAKDFRKKIDEISKLLCFLRDDNNNIEPADVFKVMLAYDDLHTKVKDIIDKYNINERYDQIIENGEKKHDRK